MSKYIFIFVIILSHTDTLQRTSLDVVEVAYKSEQCGLQQWIVFLTNQDMSEMGMGKKLMGIPTKKSER